jgi:hypothetical protein
MLELFRQCDIYFFHFFIGYEKNPGELQLLKKYGCDPSSVIKIVKMKYNQIDIKLKFFKTYTSRSRSFITTLFHSSVQFFLF